MITRDEYLNILKRFKDKELIKIITGIRRCGKSSLLELFKEYLKKQNAKFIQINFESLEFEHLSDYKELYKYIKSKIKSGKYYLLFDEIQVVKDWQKAIESFRLDFECDIYITGSNSDLLSGEFSTYLTGRFVEIKLLPLSFAEFLEFHELGNEFSLEDKFQKYIYGHDNSNLYTCAYNMLKQRKLTLALAESVTAGRLSSEFVGNNDGASDVLIEGIACYSVQSKCMRFGLSQDFFALHSPQSLETSKALVNALSRQTGADACIAVTGYASNKPSENNGEEFIAVYYKSQVYTQRVRFEGTRNHIMQQAAKYSFMFLIKLIQALEN